MGWVEGGGSLKISLFSKNRLAQHQTILFFQAAFEVNKDWANGVRSGAAHPMGVGVSNDERGKQLCRRAADAPLGWVLASGGVLESMLPKKIKRHQGKELYD